MAYSTSNPPFMIAGGISGGAREWIYSSTDSFATVAASGYFTNAFELGLRKGDQIRVIDNDALTVNTLVVTAHDLSAETVTITAMLYEELTVSGAVTPGVQSVELNHASTVVAATIADFKNHQGLFVVKDTSASGTAAHTLTTTIGTLDGTNNVATLNAPNEALIIWVDSSGDGTVIANIGTVALS